MLFVENHSACLVLDEDAKSADSVQVRQPLGATFPGFVRPHACTFGSLWATILAGLTRVLINNSKHQRDETLCFSSASEFKHAAASSFPDREQHRSSKWKELISYVVNTTVRDSVRSPALTLRGFCVMSSKLVDSRLSFMATYRFRPSSSGSRECRSPAASGRVSSRPFWISSGREEEEFVLMTASIQVQTSLIDLTFSFQCHETMKHLLWTDQQRHTQQPTWTTS